MNCFYNLFIAFPICSTNNQHLLKKLDFSLKLDFFRLLEQITTTPIRYFSVRRVGERVEFLSSKRYKNDHPEQIVKVEVYLYSFAMQSAFCV